MSARNYQSGSAKRKLKKQKDDQLKKFAGSITKYVVSASSKNNNALSENVSHDDGGESVMSSILDSNLPSNVSELPSNVSELPSNVSELPSNVSELPSNTSDLLNKDTVCLSIYSGENNLSSQTTIQKFQVCYDVDPASWLKIEENMIDFFIANPPNQNLDILSETERQIGNTKRSLTIGNFYRVKQNSEKVLRKWLVLSPSTKNLYCWVCKLITKNGSSNQLITGFNDWKHVSVRLSEHENSAQHRQAALQLSQRMNISQRIDSSLIRQYEDESNYWTAVLKRVVAVIKFLSQRGLPFFGENETVGSRHNGNFLGCMEVIAQFDSFLASHLEKYGNPGSGKVSYLSSTSINEFIAIMANKVLKHIVSEVLVSKYFSIIVDSTPDLTHLDQLCFVVRYVIEDQPVERFLKFIPIYNHRSETLAEVVLTTLKELGLDILDCRGQSYDNAANMAGKYSGLQARIKTVNPLAEFVPCSAHSLNLVGVNAVESCSVVLKFFCLVQQIYNFFSVSTHRWQKLKEQTEADGVKFSLKNRSATRWCADASAVKSLRKNYSSLLKVLNVLSTAEDENASTKSEASSLYKKFSKFETALNIVVWDTLLQRLYQTSIELQKVSINLSQVVPLYKSLMDFTQYVRDNFNLYEKLAEELFGENQSYETFRIRKTPKSKDPDALNATEAQLTSREQYISMCHYAVCDSLISHLSDRKEKYKILTKNFASLINMKSSLNLHEEASYFQKCYVSDIADTFPDELQQFSSLVQEGDTTIQMLKKVRSLEETFPNVETALRIFLTLPVSNCSGERSFSLLKRIKSSTRTTLLQEKLSSLSLLCIESEITQKLNFEDVITDFATTRVRKKYLH